MSEKVISTIFVNLETLLQLHVELLQALEDTVTSGDVGIGIVFAKKVGEG